MTAVRTNSFIEKIQLPSPVHVSMSNITTQYTFSSWETNLPNCFHFVTSSYQLNKFLHSHIEFKVTLDITYGMQNNKKSVVIRIGHIGEKMQPLFHSHLLVHTAHVDLYIIIIQSCICNILAT